MRVVLDSGCPWCWRSGARGEDSKCSGGARRIVELTLLWHRWPTVSVWFAQELVCGGCRYAFSANLARGIHARRIPEVRAQILAGQLHHIHCPACNAIVDAHRDVAYTDFARHHWVHVSTPGALSDWQSVERYALGTFDRYMLGGPPAVAEVARAFRIRVVFDLDELREKLAIWDAGLDDALIECMKLICLREYASIAAMNRRLRVRAIEPDAFVMAAVDLQHPRVDVARWTTPRAAFDDVVKNRVDWESRFPALFKRGFLSLDRYFRGA